MLKTRQFYFVCSNTTLTEKLPFSLSLQNKNIFYKWVLVGVLTKYKVVKSVFQTLEDILRNTASNFMVYGLFAIYTDDRTDSDDTLKANYAP